MVIGAITTAPAIISANDIASSYQRRGSGLRTACYPRSMSRRRVAVALLALWGLTTTGPLDAQVAAPATGPAERGGLPAGT